MGLDQYLTAKVFLSKFGKTNEDKLVKRIRKIFAGMPSSDNLDYVEIDFQIGYWRKANHIHRWFVDNVQNGKDDCGVYSVSMDELKQLRDLCKKVNDAHDKQISTFDVIKNKVPAETLIADPPKEAENLLPVQSGFFFGSTEYDDGYYTDNEYTIKLIDQVLNWETPYRFTFQYHSSW